MLNESLIEAIFIIAALTIALVVIYAIKGDKKKWVVFMSGLIKSTLLLVKDDLIEKSPDLYYTIQEGIEQLDVMIEDDDIPIDEVIEFIYSLIAIMEEVSKEYGFEDKIKKMSKRTR